MISEAQKPYLLSTEDKDFIYDFFVRSKLKQVLARGASPQKPVAYFLAAQPGSGKTKLRVSLDSSESIVVNTDDLRWLHRDFESLLKNPATNERAAYLVNPDASEWGIRLFDECIENKCSIIVDSTMGGILPPFIQRFNQLHDAGYRIEIHVMGIHWLVSRLGIYLRYERTVKNGLPERMVSMKVHDLNYKNLPENIKELYNLCAEKIDSLTIYSRNESQELNIFYQTFKPCNYGDAIDALRQVRERAFSKQETLNYNNTVNEVKEMILGRGGDPTQFLADVDLSLLFDH